MTEENEKKSLESLGQTWSEKVKNIRQTAKKGETGGLSDTSNESSIQNTGPGVAESDTVFTEEHPEKGESGGLSDTSNESLIQSDGPAVAESDAVVTEENTEKISVEELFAGDANFYKSMDNMPLAGSAPPLEPAPQHSHKQSLLVQKFLIGCLVLTCLFVLLCGAWFFMSSLRLNSPPLQAGIQQTGFVPSEADGHLPVPESMPMPDPEQPISLQIAQNYYLDSEYAQAQAVYERLLQDLPETDEEGLRDFLRLHIALCLQKSGRDEESAELLKTISLSSSAIIRVLANYHLCLYEMEKKQFLAARMRAYRAIGLLDIVGFDADWLGELRQNCSFLAAEAVTREALMLGDADEAFPSHLWPRFDLDGLLSADLTEESLERVLDAGTQQFRQALLGPKIQEVNRDGISYWTVHCSGASIGELLSRFSANAGYDVCWKTDSDRMAIRNRSVSLYLTAVNGRQFITVAAGCAGLLAYFDDNHVVTVCNPIEYDYDSGHVSLLSSEAVLFWQKYLLAFREERYREHAHFALGLLYAQQDLAAESLAEYKKVSGVYSRSMLGASVLTCSANLKTSLHDYSGAYNDLKEAVEQYPDYDKIGYTYVALADAARKIGRDEEAAKLYCKVYYLNSSPELQSAGALAAGTIFYEDQNFAEAEKWLTRYVDVAEDEQDQNFYQACLLLGKTWLSLDKPELAYEALRAALSGRLSRQDYMNTVDALVEGYMQQECYIKALQVLHDTSTRQLTQAESTHVLILESRVLRGIGLTDKAVTLLTNREKYVIDEFLKTQIGYELSDCYIEQGQLVLARKKLVHILEAVDSEPVAHKTALKLADVCRQLGLDDQAISIASELLRSHPSDAIEREASKLLASVYHKQKDYDRAALLLMEQ